MGIGIATQGHQILILISRSSFHYRTATLHGSAMQCDERLSIKKSNASDKLELLAIPATLDRAIGVPLPSYQHSHGDHR